MSKKATVIVNNHPVKGPVAWLWLLLAALIAAVVVPIVLGVSAVILVIALAIVAVVVLALLAFFGYAYFSQVHRVNVRFKTPEGKVSYSLKVLLRGKDVWRGGRAYYREARATKSRTDAFTTAVERFVSEMTPLLQEALKDQYGEEAAEAFAAVGMNFEINEFEW